MGNNYDHDAERGRWPDEYPDDDPPAPTTPSCERCGDPLRLNHTDEWIDVVGQRADGSNIFEQGTIHVYHCDACRLEYTTDTDRHGTDALQGPEPIQAPDTED